MSLKEKTLSGLLWTVVDTFILRGLTFLSTILLARWLGPEEFGLIGMISVFIAIGNTIADSGMSASIIRMNNPTDRDLSTVFVLNLILSGTFYVFVFLLAPVIAKFFEHEILTSLIRIYGISFIINALSGVQLAILNRRMEFKKIMRQNLPGTILGVVVSIILAKMGFGVWSIVFMYLSTQFMQSLVLWCFSDWRPSFKFSPSAARYHFGFGYKLMISGILNTVFQNIYSILIGKFYTVKELGYFERSRTFADYPVSVFTSVINKVSYPLMSSIRDDKISISRVYRKIMRVSFFVSCPLMFGAAAVSLPLFKFVLGNHWLPAVPYFKILCLSSIFYPIHAFNLNVFKVYGKSDLFLKLEIYKKIVILIGLVIGFRFGIFGLVWSCVISNYLALFINTYYSSTMIDYSSKQQFVDMLPTLVISSIMYFLVERTLFIFPFQAPIVLIFFGILLCVVIYFLLNHLIRSAPLAYIMSVLRSRIVSNFKKVI